jgi:exopolysaccharide production protein ExoQ
MQWALPLAVLAVLSTLWSQFPLYTIRRSLPFALAGTFGLYLATRFPVWRQLRIVRITMIALAVGTVIMAVAFPRLGLDASAGHHADWQGVFTQKNACGRIMVLATAVLLANWKTSWQRIVSAVLFLFVMLMSGSVSASLAVFTIFPAAAFAGFLYFRTLLAWMGRDITLSGRTLIWNKCGSSFSRGLGLAGDTTPSGEAFRARRFT